MAARGLPGLAAAMLRSCGGWVVGLECSEWWEELAFIDGGGEGYREVATTRASC